MNSYYKKVLVVDDDPILRNLLHEHLRVLDYQVSLVDGGQEALDLLQTEHFPLILSDLHMPRVNGMEIMEQVKKSSPGTEVIIVTGDHDKDILADIIQAGAYDYLEKPFSIFELKAKLKRFAREKELLKENREKENLYRSLVESSPT